MPQTTPTAYATELRTLRNALHYTQAQMAAALGMRRQSYARYESQLRHVPEPVIRLARQVAESPPLPTPVPVLASNTLDRDPATGTRRRR